MNLFVHKHYKGGNAAVFTFIINIGIWFRASLAAATSVFKVDKKYLLKTKLILFFRRRKLYQSSRNIKCT